MVGMKGNQRVRECLCCCVLKWWCGDCGGGGGGSEGLRTPTQNDRGARELERMVVLDKQNLAVPTVC